MNRQQRRRVHHKIVKLIETDGDNCSLCRAPFQHNCRSFGGVTSTGTIALVGECCVERLVCTLTSGAAS